MTSMILISLFAACTLFPTKETF